MRGSAFLLGVVVAVAVGFRVFARHGMDREYPLWIPSRHSLVGNKRFVERADFCVPRFVATTTRPMNPLYLARAARVAPATDVDHSFRTEGIVGCSGMKRIGRRSATSAIHGRPLRAL